MSKRFFTLDYIFLYICLILILWMYLSYCAVNDIPRDNMSIERISGALEVRDYKKGNIIGKEIVFSNFGFWSEVKKVKKELSENGIKLVEYPYYLYFAKDGKTSVYFYSEETTKYPDGFEVLGNLEDTAYVGFNWYPTENNQKKTLEKIDRILGSSSIGYDKNGYWVEVVAPPYIIPFMAHNGVFVPMKK